MPKNLSPIQLRANRENAKLSTGPRTPEGKAASTANLQKALAARREAARLAFIDATAITPEESVVLQIMHDEAIEQHKPANDDELHIVEQMVRNQLSLWRCQTAQTTILTHLTREAARAGHANPAAKAMADAALDAAYISLDKIAARCNRQRGRFFADLRQCRKLKTESAANATVPQPDPVGPIAIEQFLAVKKERENQLQPKPSNETLTPPQNNGNPPPNQQNPAA